MEDKGGLCVRSPRTKRLQGVVEVEKGERHHHKRRIAKMEVVLNLCANKEAPHEDHARKT
jgi:hypothetical protein